IRNEVHKVDRHATLRPNLFYFTICPNCGIAILTNRDLGKELRCRVCNTVHKTAESKRDDLHTLLIQIQSALGRVPTPMKGLLQVLLIQPYEASSMPLVEAICTASGFTQVPKGS